MPFEIFDLPDYPCKRDMWDALREESRPIVVYGMGNGADKLIRRFEKYGIRIADIFASDGFVRGHHFRGFRVKSFSEIRAEYSEFVIILSFASNKAEVISMLEEIDDGYDMLVPDMPVAGEDEYFDREFYNSHYDDIIRAYNSLYDEESKSVFSAVVNYKLTGKLKYLRRVYSTTRELYSLMPCGNIINSIDAGAYNGDTVREAKAYFKSLKKVYAIEPDPKNFKKITKYSEAETDIQIDLINAAAWSSDSFGEFSGSGNRNSTISATASYENKKTYITLRKIDSIADERIDYIKFDVEGAEREALFGSYETIRRDRPTMLVSVYHRSRDIFDVINLLHGEFPFYKLYLRRLRCIPAWELDLILIP